MSYVRQPGPRGAVERELENAAGMTDQRNHRGTLAEGSTLYLHPAPSRAVGKRGQDTVSSRMTPRLKKYEQLIVKSRIKE